MRPLTLHVPPISIFKQSTNAFNMHPPTRNTGSTQWCVAIPNNNAPTMQESTTKLNQQIYSAISPIKQLNSAYDFTKIPALVKFLHATAFSPVKSTWLKAIKKGFFQLWPGLTTQAGTKHFPQSEATTKGHMDQTWKNIPTTQSRANQPKQQMELEDHQPKQETNNASTQQLFEIITETGIYTDQTGQFPVTTNQGNKYILVLCNYNTNAILTKPLMNCTGNEILRVYQKLHTYLTRWGFQPHTHWLDNEGSGALKRWNNQQQVTFQVVSPHMHRPNAAKCAIHTWKNHFVVGLCSTDSNFPMHLWDQLLPQATTITLNLLQQSRRNPKISAYQKLEGNYDFNSAPMAPPGTKIILQEKPNQQKTWEPHGTDGWYLGPALKHYCCFWVFINKTKTERTLDTVAFFLQHTPVPYWSPMDVAI
jgi:hypothetical protein